MTFRDPVSVAIVEAVAARDGVDPTAMEPPLYDVVDTEALDALFQPQTATTGVPTHVRFRYRGYTVTVDETGTVEIAEHPPETEQPQTGDSVGD